MVLWRKVGAGACEEIAREHADGLRWHADLASVFCYAMGYCVDCVDCVDCVVLLFTLCTIVTTKQARGVLLLAEQCRVELLIKK